MNIKSHKFILLSSLIVSLTSYSNAFGLCNEITECNFKVGIAQRLEINDEKNKIITFPDKNLENAIRSSINKPEGAILR